MTRVITPHRVTFEGSDVLLGDLQMVGWARFPRAAPGVLASHVHPNIYEICLILRGVVEWWVEDEVWEVGPNHIYLTFPGERHGGVGAVMNPCELFWIQVHLPRGRSLSGTTHDLTCKLHRLFASVSQRVIPAEPGMHACYQALIHEHRNPGYLATEILQARLLELLTLTLRAAHRAQQRLMANDGRVVPLYAQALRIIQQDIHHQLTVESLAAELNVSTAHLRSVFQHEGDLSPKQVLAARRLRAARAMIRAGESVTRVAMKLNYASSQHLAAAFRVALGMSPTAYRRLTGEVSPLGNPAN